MHPERRRCGEHPDGDRQRLLRDAGRRGVRPRCGFRPDAACPGKERTGCCPDARDVRCRRRGRGACPGTWRTGCCRDGDRPGGVPSHPGVPEQPGFQPWVPDVRRAWRPSTARPEPGAARSAGQRELPVLREPPGRHWAAGAAAAGAGASVLVSAAPVLRGSRSRRGRRTGCRGAGGCLGGGRGRFGLRSCCCVGERVAEFPHNGGLNGGRGRANEFAQFLQFGYCIFGSNTELFSKLMYADLGHISPVSVRTEPGTNRLLLTADLRRECS